MTKIELTQSDPVLVAIDISKHRHEVLISIPSKKRRRRLTVLNQLDDFDRLVAVYCDATTSSKNENKHSGKATSEYSMII